MEHKFRETARCFYFPLPPSVAALLSQDEKPGDPAAEWIKQLCDVYFADAARAMREEVANLIPRYVETDREGRQNFYMAVMLTYSDDALAVVVAAGTKSGVEGITQVYQASKRCAYGEVYRCQVTH